MSNQGSTDHGGSDSGVYRNGKNWTAQEGNFYNGHGQQIREPVSYFNAVAQNRYDYNAKYENGYGETIRNPPAYYNTVAQNKYGYSD